MGRLLQGNGRNERINGIALDFSGVTVTTTDTTWKERASGCTLNYTNAFTNDGSDGIVVTTTGGSLSYDGIPPPAKANQKVLFWLSAHFGTNGQGVILGDEFSGIGIEIKNTQGYLTMDDSNYIEFAPSATSVGSLDRSLFFLLDLADGSGTRYQYTDAGAFVESAAGTSYGTVDSFDLTADGIYQIITASTIFKTKSFGMGYFDEIPVDLTAGFEWMAANPTLGIYPAWREI